MRKEWTIKWQFTHSHHPYISSLSPSSCFLFFLNLKHHSPFLAFTWWLLKGSWRELLIFLPSNFIIYPACVPICSAFHPLQWITTPCTSKARLYPCHLHPLTHSKICSLFSHCHLSFLHHWHLFLYWIIPFACALSKLHIHLHLLLHIHSVFTMLFFLYSVQCTCIITIS